MGYEKRIASNTEQISTMKRREYFAGAGMLFQHEDELLKHIFSLEKREARKTLINIHNLFLQYAPDYVLRVFESYYIVLSSIVTREMRNRNFLDGDTAFTFNAVCVRVITENLTVHNILTIGEELIELYCYTMRAEKEVKYANDTVNEVIRHVNHNIQEPLSVEEIASRFSVSTSHLSRIFRECTSVTLVEYIMIRKIEEIQFYLRFTDEKIADIAERFNFCNQSYFTRVFKKYTGFTPKRFRTDLTGQYFQFTMKQDDSL